MSLHEEIDNILIEWDKERDPIPTSEIIAKVEAKTIENCLDALQTCEEWYEGLNSGRIDLRTQPKSGWWQQEYNLTTNPAIQESRHGGYYLKLLTEAGKRTPKDAYLKMLNMIPYPIRNKLDLLKEVGETIPVLQMMGGHECQGEILAGYELHKHIPNSEFILNPDCWHACPREHPEYFNWIVHEWLKRHGL